MAFQKCTLQGRYPGYWSSYLINSLKRFSLYIPRWSQRTKRKQQLPRWRGLPAPLLPPSPAHTGRSNYYSILTRQCTTPAAATLPCNHHYSRVVLLALWSPAATATRPTPTCTAAIAFCASAIDATPLCTTRKSLPHTRVSL